MLRKLATCAAFALALTLTGCANTTTSAAEESSVGFDASAKAVKSGECADKAAECSAEKAKECATVKTECCSKDAATKN